MESDHLIKVLLTWLLGNCAKNGESKRNHKNTIGITCTRKKQYTTMQEEHEVGTA